MFLPRHKTKPSPYGEPNVGYFGLEDETTSVYDKCREQFSVKFTESKTSLLFCHPAGRGINVASFLNKTEQIIGIRDLKHSFGYSSFAETDKENILWIEPSRFWMTSEIKRQLLTIFLRVGIDYMGNYEGALWSHNHVLLTKSAIIRFLYGFTNFVLEDDTAPPDFWSNRNIGWVSIFSNSTVETVRNRLRLPYGETRKPFLIGIGELWA